WITCFMRSSSRLAGTGAPGTSDRSIPPACASGRSNATTSSAVARKSTRAGRSGCGRANRRNSSTSAASRAISLVASDAAPVDPGELLGARVEQEHAPVGVGGDDGRLGLLDDLLVARLAQRQPLLQQRLLHALEELHPLDECLAVRLQHDRQLEIERPRDRL